MTQVGLQDTGCSFFQDFTEASFCKNAFSRGDGEVCAACDVGEDVDILGLARLFYEHRLIGFKLLDENLCGLRWYSAVEVNADVHRFATSFSERCEVLDRVPYEPGVFYGTGRIFLRHASLDDGIPFCHALFHFLSVGGAAVDTDAVARRTTEEFINRNVEELTFDIPKRLVDATERAGKDRTSAIKCVAINSLPVVYHLAGVFADQVGLDLLDSGLDSKRSALEKRFTQTCNARVGV